LSGRGWQRPENRGEPPNVAAAAYHCQKAAEKLIKAVLVVLRIAYPRGRLGHDLGLAAAQIPSGHKLRAAAEAFDTIADWSISFRYPSDDPLQAEPLPESDEIAVWMQHIAAFRAEVASLVAAPFD
jgi:HEPN domain-containing protein